MHPSAIKLLIIDAHILDYLHGAYSISTKDFKNTITHMHTQIPRILYFMAYGVSYYGVALDTLYDLFNSIKRGEYQYAITINLLLPEIVLFDLCIEYKKYFGNTPVLTHVLVNCPRQFTASIILEG